MKKIAVLFVFALLAKFSAGQSFKSEMSELVDGDIGKPVLLMKDGTTIFQYDDEKERKMYLTVFDKNHAVIVNRKEPGFSKIQYVYHFSYQKSTNVSYWEEKSGKALIHMESEYKPFVVTVDPKTGSVLSEENIDIDKVPVSGYSQANSRSMEHHFEVMKKGVIDESTGNTFETDYNHKQLNKAEALARTDFSDITTMDFVIRNSAGKEIKRTPFDFVNKKYQDVRSLKTYFDKGIVYYVSKEFVVKDRATYDAPSYGKGQEGVVCLTKYNMADGKFTHLELYDIKDGVDFDNCMILHSEDNSIFNLRFVVKTGHQNGGIASEAQVFYEIFFQPIDINKFSAGKPFYLPSEKLDEFVKANCKQKDGYAGGMIDKCIMDKKGNIFVTKIKNVTTASDFSGHTYSLNPELIGISCFDANGKEIYGTAFPYNSNNVGVTYSFDYSPSVNRSDFTYLLSEGSKNKILFLDNLSKNFNLPLDEKPGVAKNLEDCNAIAVEVADDGQMKQYYVFGEPETKKNNRYADFAFSLYDENTNTYVVRVYEGPGYKKSHAGWIKVN
ncbi:MAG: hypothetical protein ACJ77K_13210 [Bacteroidia bacterium]